MDRCEQIARTTSRNLLCWLLSKRPHGCSAKPFTFIGKAVSGRKYNQLLKRFVAMVFHAYCLPANTRRRQAGIQFNKSHLHLIAALWNHESIKLSGGAGLEADCEEESVDEEECGDEEGDNETESGSSDSDKSEIGEVEDEERKSEGENDEDDEGEGEEIDMTGNSSEQRPPLIETALELLFGLIMAFSTGEVVDGRSASTLLVFFSGVARLEDVRQKDLVLGSQSRFEELFSLLALSRAMAGSETPAFLLKWSDYG
ncbi:hypothetical protein EDB81DRAFT_845505 [Dactylonectria macrodidyma]|uniref:Uncharacterized protein n=1 Tax=Dactylonectria macrodidyma TaxID=307937 RepID=A0A9P9E6G6_9HYPO|nr:hypothetical protein EDB81DRAFT_845505 [Dactylonectria macrodidyma]